MLVLAVSSRQRNDQLSNLHEVSSTVVPYRIRVTNLAKDCSTWSRLVIWPRIALKATTVTPPESNYDLRLPFSFILYGTLGGLPLSRADRQGKRMCEKRRAASAAHQHILRASALGDPNQMSVKNVARHTGSQGCTRC
jgi:hypothetical protein